MSRYGGEFRRVRLSVAMLGFDDAVALSESLMSIKGRGDEVLVVDCGQSGEASRAALSHGARVIRRAWNDDLSAVRNMALGALSGDWVLWLEAGEILDATSAAEMRTFLDAPTLTPQACSLWLETPPVDPRSMAERVAVMRMFPRVPEIEYQGRIGESILASMQALGWPETLCPWRLVRSAREHDQEFKRVRALRELRLIDLELQERGPRPEVLNHLGEMLVLFGEPAAARQRFQQSLAIAARGSTEMLAAYYGLLTTFGDQPAEQEAQVAACLEALAIYPLDAQLLTAMGGYLQAQGRYDLAIRAFQAAADHGQIDPRTWHVTDVAELAIHCLAICRQLNREGELAREALMQGVARFPYSQRLRMGLISILVRMGRGEEAAAQVDALPIQAPAREALRSAVRGASLAAQQNWIPAREYLEAAFRAGCRDPLCLRNLTLCLLALGEDAASLPVVRAWLTVEPENTEAQGYERTLARQGVTAPAPAGAGGHAAGTSAPRYWSILSPGDKPVAAPSPSSIPADAVPEVDMPADGSPAAISRGVPSVRSPHWRIPPVSAPGATNEIAPAWTETQPIREDGGSEIRQLRLDAAKAPTDSRIHMRLGDAYRQLGDTATAEAVWRAHLERCPQAAEVALALAEILIATGRATEAQPYVELLRQAGPKARGLVALLEGLMAGQRGAWDAAVRQLESARDAGITLPVLWQQLAIGLIQVGRLSDAQAILAHYTPPVAGPAPQRAGQTVAR